MRQHVDWAHKKFCQLGIWLLERFNVWSSPTFSLWPCLQADSLAEADVTHAIKAESSAACGDRIFEVTKMLKMDCRSKNGFRIKHCS